MSARYRARSPPVNDCNALAPRLPQAAVHKFPGMDVTLLCY